MFLRRKLTNLLILSLRANTSSLLRELGLALHVAYLILGLGLILSLKLGLALGRKRLRKLEISPIKTLFTWARLSHHSHT